MCISAVTIIVIIYTVSITRTSDFGIKQHTFT